MRRLLALTLVIASAPGLAQEEMTGPYVGFMIGQIDYEDNFANRIDYGDTMSATNLRAGYRFNDTLAIEGYYGTSGSFNDPFSGSVPTFQADDGTFVGGPIEANLSGEIDTIEIRVLAHTGHVVLGLGYFSMDVSGAMTGTVELGFPAAEPPQPPGASFRTNLADDDSGYSIIIGLHFDLNENWAIRGEYEYFDVSSPADVSVIGVGMQYGF